MCNISRRHAAIVHLRVSVRHVGRRFFFLLLFSRFQLSDEIDYPVIPPPHPPKSMPDHHFETQWAVIHRVFEIALGYHVVCPVFRIITLRPIKNNPLCPRAPPARIDLISVTRASRRISDVLLSGV